MAFTSSNTGSSNAANTNTDWKAQAFINFSLPTADGKGRKIGAIALKESNESDKWLIEYLAKDPANISKLLAKLTVDFHQVKTGAAAGFALD